VSYRVEFRPAAAEQTIGLPADAFVALIQALGVVSRDPFDETATMASPDVHVRRVMFGDAGMASFYIDPATELISVFAVVWAG
jgi:hypothetical protein